MNNQESFKNNLSLNFSKIGFRDYLASRFLLINEFNMQGITLASSAVEKYMKAILIANGKRIPVHLDKQMKLKKTFEKLNINLFEKLDPAFLEILSDAYKLRYYDNYKGKISFGFITHQVLAELDYSVNLMDSMLIYINTIDNKVIQSAYKKSLLNAENHLINNNYIISNDNKKQIMEKAGRGYFLMVQENGQQFEMTGGDISQVEYNGKIVRLTDHNFE